jgi:shikimate dehydrogenase
VLGCGGSARAVVAGLVELGVEGIQLAGRRPEALAAFQADCSAWAPQLTPLIWPGASAGPGEWRQALARADLVVNTTPLGMAAASPRGEDDPGASCPLAPDDLDALRPGGLVYDLIYTPRPSRLLREIRQRGCIGIDGLEMLVQQGAAALGLWIAGALEPADVPVAAMRRAALEQLGDG